LSIIFIGCFHKTMNYYYYLKRIFLVIPTLLGISFITFLLLKALPGDPAQGMAGQRADPEVLRRIAHEIGTDKSTLGQYAGYLRLISRGELGRSYYTNRMVRDDLAEKLPNTIRLASGALFFSIVLGLALGVLMAATRGSVWDRCALIVSTGGISIPVFWLGLLLMYLFSFHLKLLPPSGMGNGSLLFLILPASTLGLNAAAYLARITRASMLEILSQAYITTAKAKGLSQGAVLGRHALKNTLIPVITLAGLDFGSFLNGSVLTETIFGWDGIGRYAVEGIFRRDYPVIMGCVLVGAVLFVTVNLLVDVLYGLCDPKIRYGAQNR
jgi:ABC-type dipeptide/oligopeptide/nickel transport system permease component